MTGGPGSQLRERPGRSVVSARAVRRATPGRRHALALTIALAVLGAVGPAAASDLVPDRLRCESLEAPLGIEDPNPRLSWALTSAVRGERQTAYRVLAASTVALLAADTGDLWDSGWVTASQSTHLPWSGAPLVSGQRVHWKVQVRGAAGTEGAWSAPTHFEMGLLGAVAWQADWINATGDTPPAGPEPAPLLRKEFAVGAGLVRARAYVAGLGLHELHLNGAKVGDHVLDPAATAYDRRALYVVHDVTAELVEGTNAVGVVLGGGWFNLVSDAVFEFDQAVWRKRPRLRLEIHLTYDDGSTERVLSDPSFRTAPSATTYDSLRGGESYDARLAQPGWSAPGFDDSTWTPALVVVPPGGALVAQTLPPMRVVETIAPVAIQSPQPGVHVVDFGRNVAGFARLSAQGAAGSTVTLRYGERLHPDGTLDTDEIGSLIEDGRVQTDTYTFAGTGVETWTPRFTYHGFQYVQIEGLAAPPDGGTLEAQVVRTDFASAGTFASSNDLVNQIYLASRASFESNFHGLPTDCPHREKNGWTGDALFAQDLGLHTFDSAPAYAKWLGDVRDAQIASGQIPPVIPTGGWGYHWGALPAWNAALVLMPWRLYQFHGDRRVLEDNYDAMRAYLAFLDAYGDGSDLLGYGLGDWLAPEPQTEVAIVSTLYFHTMARTLSEIATVLGKPADAQLYADMADRVRDVFDIVWRDPSTGFYTFDTQTALTCVAHQGLAEGAARTDAIDRAASQLESTNHALTIGAVGSTCLLPALVAGGHGETAYAAATQTADPSWGHFIAQGATTLWENWPGDRSRNHVYFGDVAAWFVRSLVGIETDPAGPGFERFVVAPGVHGDLAWIGATVETLRGPIEVQWAKTGPALDLSLRVPVGSTATLRLPAAPGAGVFEGGAPAAAQPGVTWIGPDDDRIVFEVASGEYFFRVDRLPGFGRRCGLGAELSLLLLPWFAVRSWRANRERELENGCRLRRR